jgi:small subunit ribosomal protein S8
VYSSAERVPLVIGGMGVNIVTTSRGVMTGKQARKQGVGGEILCSVY